MYSPCMGMMTIIRRVPTLPLAPLPTPDFMSPCPKTCIIHAPRWWIYGWRVRWLFVGCANDGSAYCFPWHPSYVYIYMILGMRHRMYLTHSHVRILFLGMQGIPPAQSATLPWDLYHLMVTALPRQNQWLATLTFTNTEWNEQPFQCSGSGQTGSLCDPDGMIVICVPPIGKHNLMFHIVVC